MKSQLSKLGASLLFVTVLSTAAQAVMLTGGVNIGAFGSTVLVDKTANTVSFSPNASVTGPNAIVTNSAGTTAGVAPLGTLGDYQDFQYDPLVSPNPLFVFAGLSFNLTQVTFIDETGPGLVLAGTGTLFAAGFDNTPGTWSFSADSSGGAFSWSSSATAVPDGGTSAALLGASLLGLAGLSRKFRKA